MSEESTPRLISVREEMDDIANQIYLAIRVKKHFGNRHPTYKPHRLIANARRQFTDLLKDVVR